MISIMALVLVISIGFLVPKAAAIKSRLTTMQSRHPTELRLGNPSVSYQHARPDGHPRCAPKSKATMPMTPTNWIESFADTQLN